MSADVVTQIIKYNAQTSGRDKLCRVFQYGSKFGWWYCEQNEKSKDLILKLKTLETAMSATRKVLRFGKSLDMLQGALKSLHIKDAVLRLTITLSKINQGCYLFLDHFIWMGKVGLIKIDTKKYAKMAARFWLVTLIFNLVRNIYDLFNLFTECLQKQGSQNSTQLIPNKDSSQQVRSSPRNTSFVMAGLSRNAPIFLDTVKNLCDLILPMSVLKKINTSEGVQGIAGVISSIIAMVTIWNPTMKLVP